MHVSFLAVNHLTAFINFFSVSALKTVHVILLPEQILQANKLHFILLQQNLTAGFNKSCFVLLDELPHLQQIISILAITSAIFFISCICFLILYIKKSRRNASLEKELHQYKLLVKDFEERLNEINNKNNELNQQFDDIKIKYEQSQKANEIKNRIMPMIAHDIRSPLATLQDTLGLVRENIIEPEEFRSLSFKLEGELFNLRLMVDNMLLWAREQMVGIKINKAKFNVCEVIQDLVFIYKNSLNSKNITLHNYMPLNLEAVSDKEIIAAVFRNVFSNAVKFTEPGKSIYISHVFLKDKSYISVKNEGKGIPAETIKKIYNNEHISTRGTANEKGTGLGLPYCKEMLTRLNETFDISSFPGHGTSVTFSVSMH